MAYLNNPDFGISANRACELADKLTLCGGKKDGLMMTFLPHHPR